jgi:lipopolysaccharide exporter
MPEFIIGNVFVVFSTVAFPLYARARTEGEAALQATLLRALMLNGLYGFTTATGLAILASDAVPVLLSDAWRPASTPMSLIALGMGLQAIGFAYGDVFPALGRPGLMLRISGPMALLLAAGIWLAASRGIVAVAWVQLLFHLLYAGVWIGVGARVVGLGVRRQLAALWPGCCASFGTVVGALPVQLALQPSGAAIAATVLAGATGATLALVVAAPSAVGEVRGLLRALLAAPVRRLTASRI